MFVALVPEVATMVVVALTEETLVAEVRVSEARMKMRPAITKSSSDYYGRNSSETSG